jgi:hypothetical protein
MGNACCAQENDREFEHIAGAKIRNLIPGSNPDGDDFES